MGRVDEQRWIDQQLLKVKNTFLEFSVDDEESAGSPLAPEALRRYSTAPFDDRRPLREADLAAVESAAVAAAASSSAAGALPVSSFYDDACCCGASSCSNGAASTAGGAGGRCERDVFGLASSSGSSRASSVPGSPASSAAAVAAALDGASLAGSAQSFQGLPLFAEGEDEETATFDLQPAQQQEDEVFAAWAPRVHRTFVECPLPEDVLIRRAASVPDFVGRPDVASLEAQRSLLGIRRRTAITADDEDDADASVKVEDVLCFPPTPRAEEVESFEQRQHPFVPSMVGMWLPTQQQQQQQQQQHQHQHQHQHLHLQNNNEDNNTGYQQQCYGHDIDEKGMRERYQAALSEEFGDATGAASGAAGAGHHRRGRRAAQAGTGRSFVAGAVATGEEVLRLIEASRRAAAEGAEGQVWSLACRDGASSIAVQRAIAMLARVLRDPTCCHSWRVRFDAEALLGQLQGHILEALQHMHANHVIKQALELLPTEFIGFIADEILGNAVWASRHKFACRTVLRLVRHCGGADQSWASASAEAVISEVLGQGAELCCDEFGKFVLEEILERGLPEQRSRVCAALRGRLAWNARHEHASFLIQRMLRSCREEDSFEIASELLGSRENVQALARSQFGRYVLRDIARCGPLGARVREVLLPLAGELQTSKHGKKLLTDIFVQF